MTKQWGVKPKNQMFKDSAFKSYTPVYGYIKEIAEKHALEPEFLHAVVMGEGLYLFLDAKTSTTADPKKTGIAKSNYNTSELINGYDYLGLDEIGDNIGNLGYEGYVDKKYFVNNGREYVDQKFAVLNEADLKLAKKMGFSESDIRYENTFKNSKIKEFWEKNQSFTFLFKGYEFGIECVAAELEQRRDNILLRAEELGINTGNQDIQNFLTYGAYNGQESDVNDMLNNFKKYYSSASITNPVDDKNTTLKYSVHRMISTTNYLKKLVVYK